jgi:hypothetical protein
MLQKGDYPLSEGTYALTIKLDEGTLPEGVQPRLLVDDAQIGLKPVSRDEVPTWQHTLRIGCPPGEGIGESKINLGFSGEGGKPLLEADPDKVIIPPEEAEKPGRPIPTLTWVGIGAVGVGAAVAIVSHFAIAKPAEADADATGRAQCMNGCSPAANTYINGQYDTADLANGIAIGGVVLAGVGAVVGTVAWFTSKPPAEAEQPHEDAAHLQVVPLIGRTIAGAQLVGSF